MKKRKNIAIPMILAATIAAVSVPCSSQIVMASDTYQVGVSKGYLALRSAMDYDSSNEIGELYSGDTVEVTEYTTSDYWYVYSPKLNLSGYVNNDYLYFLKVLPEIQGLSVLPRVIWLCVLQRLMTLPTRSDSYTPVIL